MTATHARRVSIVAGGLVLAGALVGCGSSGSGKQPGRSPAQPTRSASTSHSPAGSASTSHSPAGSASQSTAAAAVVIRDFGYQVPASVDAGATATVKNMDQVAHTVTADQSASLFDVTVDPGKTGTFTAPSKPGTYKFHCTFHSDMHGTLVVK